MELAIFAARGRNEVQMADPWDQFRYAMLTRRFFEAHEFLEIPWRKNHSMHLRVAIWAAAAFVHWQKSNFSGATRLFARILDTPDAVDLPIRDAIQSWLAALSRSEPLVDPKPGELSQLIEWGHGK